MVAILAMIGVSVMMSGGSLMPSKIANADKLEGSKNVAPMLIKVDMMPSVIEISSALFAIR